MISSLGVGAESDKYRPELLCPEFKEACEKLENGIDTKEENIEAVEKYTKALCAKLAANLQEKLAEKAESDTHAPLHPPPTPIDGLNDIVRKNLEKVAAKNFSPSFAKTKGKSFDSLKKQAQKRTEKYAVVAKEEHDKFAEQRVTERESSKKEQKKDGDQYKDRVKARLEVYQGWKFEEKTDGTDGFILSQKEEGKPYQEITVTKNPNGSFTIKSTSNEEVTDEAIGIMIELSHSVLRFNNNKNMNMTVKGLDGNPAITNKFKQGLDIINKDKIFQEEHKEGEGQLKYRFENKDKKN
ncbi:MAG: hypothetical protein ABSA84_00705 [Gammaproteobacteria bacterium]|jgi:hypothetical protein